MSSLSSLNGPEAEPSQASGGRCCPMEEGSGDLASNGRGGAVPRAPRRLGCAGGGAGGAAILDGRGRGSGGAGPGAGRVSAGVPADPETARRSPTRLGCSRSGGGREVPRAV